MSNIFIENTLSQFNSITKKPEIFLSDPSSIVDNVQLHLKESYDFIKNEETQKSSNTLPELIIKNFDTEQIWQQIELQNDTLLNNSLLHIGRLTAAKDSSLWFELDEGEESGEKVEEVEEEVVPEDNLNDEEPDSSESEFEDISKDEKITSRKKETVRSSIVDDDFFKLREMEEFLKREERSKPNREESDSEKESIDLFDPDMDEDEDDEDVANPKYGDFYVDAENEEQEEKSLDDDSSGDEKEELKSDDDDDDDDNETNKEPTQTKSSYEVREERLQKKIKDLEEKALQDKPWQLKGEITASKRPQNSLLQEIVEFDLTSRPAPVITQETTFKLEDVIKQRIKDKVFDDVERKIKPVEEPMEYKKQLVLDQEKSKQSLAQIYETEYLKQKEALDPDAADKPVQEPKEHLEIKQMMKELFSKLDALSNFHFTPKPVAPELKVINNLPVISMEEIAPVAVSDAALLAPEEVKSKPKGDVIGKEERTKTDKNRERRKKKIKQKIHALEKQKKETSTDQKLTKKGAANLVKKVSKDRNVDLMKENSKVVKSSTTFFSQLEDEVKSQMKNSEGKKRKKEKPHLLAKRIKL